MIKEEIIEFCEMKAELEPENEDIYEAIINVLEQEPCEDCISREAVLDLAKKGVLVSNGNYESVCKAINDLPSVTPKYTDEEIDRAQAVEEAYIDKMVELTVEESKKVGHWMVNKEKSLAKCSNCKFSLKNKDEIKLFGTFIQGYNYCPYCGAKMS
ncbi:hypothetical protein SAMN05660484_02601 [Eubacterium ruminantium]|uniref:Uncharacterized protein n=1 Tax=Eubacterium ruminantium TaxID=42322 RepID=A0A1T4QWM4_9FIRM|nr:hypothetical protein [Eubacterium ruminantium]SCW70449.1 hypothetical protein SAMN05660484_02601 [Eubacterium ruminantium]SDN47545.1 hypothetical protein SAMN04490370_1302 [Eubacterium ruminantium]SKA08162.1 hypothetical protein SAMN02745110_02552 [Eubacterium ruminantium]